jgi:hypothetical protein
MVAPTCSGITLPSSGSTPNDFWEMFNWGAVDRILWMGALCLLMWCSDPRLTLLQVFVIISPASFCLLVSRFCCPPQYITRHSVYMLPFGQQVLLSSTVNYKAFRLYFANNFFCISSFFPQLLLYLVVLQFLCSFYNLSNCVLLFFLTCFISAAVILLASLELKIQFSLPCISCKDHCIVCFHSCFL